MDREGEPRQAFRPMNRRPADIQMTPAKTVMANNPEQMHDMSAELYDGNRNEFSSVTAMINERPKPVTKTRQNRLFSDVSSIHHSPRAHDMPHPHT